MRFPRLTALALLCLAADLSLAQDMKIPDSLDVQANISYGPAKQNVLDIVRRKDLPAGTKRLGAVYIHGGGWTQGSKESYFNRYVVPLAEKGYVVANVEYRLADVAQAPAAVEDSLAAARWFRDNAKTYGIDPKRIIVIGGSAGGHLALMVGMADKTFGKPFDPAAVINMRGITDVQDLLDGPNKRDFALAWIPESERTAADLVRKVSPISYVRKNVPPILTIHGDADETVPYPQAVELTRQLRKLNADAEMVVIPGGKHGLTPAQDATMWTAIWDFLGRHKLLP